MFNVDLCFDGSFTGHEEGNARKGAGKTYFTQTEKQMSKRSETNVNECDGVQP